MCAADVPVADVRRDLADCHAADAELVRHPERGPLGGRARLLDPPLQLLRLLPHPDGHAGKCTAAPCHIWNVVSQQ